MTERFILQVYISKGFSWIWKVAVVSVIFSLKIPNAALVKKKKKKKNSDCNDYLLHGGLKPQSKECEKLAPVNNKLINYKMTHYKMTKFCNDHYKMTHHPRAGSLLMLPTTPGDKALTKAHKDSRWKQKGTVAQGDEKWMSGEIEDICPAWRLESTVY